MPEGVNSVPEGVTSQPAGGARSPRLVHRALPDGAPLRQRVGKSAAGGCEIAAGGGEIAAGGGETVVEGGGRQ
eukprot:3794010-Pyramimonas_sp.AAC.1